MILRFVQVRNTLHQLHHTYYLMLHLICYIVVVHGMYSMEALHMLHATCYMPSIATHQLHHPRVYTYFEHSTYQYISDHL